MHAIGPGKWPMIALLQFGLFCFACRNLCSGTDAVVADDSIESDTLCTSTVLSITADTTASFTGPALPGDCNASQCVESDR